MVYLCKCLLGPLNNNGRRLKHELLSHTALSDLAFEATLYADGLRGVFDYGKIDCLRRFADNSYIARIYPIGILKLIRPSHVIRLLYIADVYHSLDITGLELAYTIAAAPESYSDRLGVNARYGKVSIRKQLLLSGKFDLNAAEGLLKIA